MKQVKRTLSLLLCVAMVITSLAISPLAGKRTVHAEGSPEPTGWAKVVGSEQSQPVSVTVKTVARWAKDDKTDQLGTAEYYPAKGNDEELLERGSVPDIRNITMTTPGAPQHPKKDDLYFATAELEVKKKKKDQTTETKKIRILAVHKKADGDIYVNIAGQNNDALTFFNAEDSQNIRIILTYYRKDTFLTVGESHQGKVTKVTMPKEVNFTDNTATVSMKVEAARKARVNVAVGYTSGVETSKNVVYDGEKAVHNYTFKVSRDAARQNGWKFAPSFSTEDISDVKIQLDKHFFNQTAVTYYEDIPNVGEKKMWKIVKNKNVIPTDKVTKAYDKNSFIKSNGQVSWFKSFPPYSDVDTDGNFTTDRFNEAIYEFGIARNIEEYGIVGKKVNKTSQENIPYGTNAIFSVAGNSFQNTIIGNEAGAQYVTPQVAYVQNVIGIYINGAYLPMPIPKRKFGQHDKKQTFNGYEGEWRKTRWTGDWNTYFEDYLNGPYEENHLLNDQQKDHPLADNPKSSYTFKGGPLDGTKVDIVLMEILPAAAMGQTFNIKRPDLLKVLGVDDWGKDLSEHLPGYMLFYKYAVFLRNVRSDLDIQPVLAPANDGWTVGTHTDGIERVAYIPSKEDSSEKDSGMNYNEETVITADNWSRIPGWKRTRVLDGVEQQTFHVVVKNGYAQPRLQLQGDQWFKGNFKGTPHKDVYNPSKVYQLNIDNAAATTPEDDTHIREWEQNLGGKFEFSNTERYGKGGPAPADAVDFKNGGNYYLKFDISAPKTDTFPTYDYYRTKVVKSSDVRSFTASARLQQYDLNLDMHDGQVKRPEPFDIMKKKKYNVETENTIEIPSQYPTSPGKIFRGYKLSLNRNFYDGGNVTARDVLMAKEYAVNPDTYNQNFKDLYQPSDVIDIRNIRLTYGNGKPVVNSMKLEAVFEDLQGSSEEAQAYEVAINYRNPDGSIAKTEKQIVRGIEGLRFRLENLPLVATENKTGFNFEPEANEKAPGQTYTVAEVPKNQDVVVSGILPDGTVTMNVEYYRPSVIQFTKEHTSDDITMGKDKVQSETEKVRYRQTLTTVPVLNPGTGFVATGWYEVNQEGALTGNPMDKPALENLGIIAGDRKFAVRVKRVLNAKAVLPTATEYPGIQVSAPGVPKGTFEVIDGQSLENPGKYMDAKDGIFVDLGAAGKQKLILPKEAPEDETGRYKFKEWTIQVGSQPAFKYDPAAALNYKAKGRSARSIEPTAENEVIVTPVFEANKLEQTFRVADGQDTLVRISKTSDDPVYGEKIDFPTFELVGEGLTDYDFVGWSYVKDGKTVVVKDTSNVPAEEVRTWTAVLEKKKGNLNFTNGVHADLAEGAVTSYENLPYGTSVSDKLPAVNPKPDYEFNNKWKKTTDDTILDQAAMANQKIGAEAVTYEPVADPKQYDVKFEVSVKDGVKKPTLVDGGDTTVTYDPDGLKNKLTKVPTLSTEDQNNYEIVKWHLKDKEEEIKNPADFVFNDANVGIQDSGKTVIFVADVKVKYTVTYELGGPVGNLSKTTEKVVDGGHIAGLPTFEATDTDYETTGIWYKNEVRTGNEVADPTTVEITADTKFIFMPNRKTAEITFTAEHATVNGKKSVQVQAKQGLTLEAGVTGFAVPEVTAEKGYRPTGKWIAKVTDQSDVELKDADAVKAYVPHAGAVTLQAEIVKEVYPTNFEIPENMRDKVDFGEDVFTKTENVTFGDKVPFPTPEITDNDYDPEGWYRKDDTPTGTFIGKTPDVTAEEAATYIFKVKAKEAALSFVPGTHATLKGDTLSFTLKQGAEIGTQVTFPEVEPKEGYEFKNQWKETTTKKEYAEEDIRKEVFHGAMTFEPVMKLKKQNVTFEIPEDQRAFVKLGDKDNAPFYEMTEPKDYFSKIVFPEPVITNGDYQEDGWYKKVGNEEKKLTAEELTNQTVKGDVTYVYKVAVKRGELVFTDGEHAQVKPQSPVTKKNLAYGTKVKSELPEVEAAANYEFNNKWQKSDASKPMTEKELEDAAVKADSATYIPVADPKTYEVSFTTKIKDGVEAPQLQNAAPTTVTYDPKNESNKLGTIPGLSDEDRKGFEIVGWHVQGKDEPEITDLSAFRFDDESTNAKGKNKAVVLVADIKVKYEVTYQVKDGVGTLTPESERVIDGGHVAKTPTFQVTDKHFAETGTWYKGTEEEKNKVENPTVPEITEATTFLFVPDRNKTTVTFTADHATLGEPATLTAKQGLKLSEGVTKWAIPSVEPNEGYKFEKIWIINGVEKTEQEVADYVPAAGETDVTIQAKVVKKTYPIQFEIAEDQHKLADFETDVFVKVETKEHGATVVFPQVHIINPNYEADGWYRKGEDQPVQGDPVVTEAATYVFKVKQRLGGLNFKNGEHATLPENFRTNYPDVGFGTKVSGYLPQDDQVKASPNYIFHGKWTKDDATPPLTKEQMSDETVTAKTVTYAPYADPKTYKVRFTTHVKDGETATPPALENGGDVQITYNPNGAKLKNVPEIPEAEKENWKIKSWHLEGHQDAIDFASFDFNDDNLKIEGDNENVVLVAELAKRYTVNFKVEGGANVGSLNPESKRVWDEETVGSVPQFTAKDKNFDTTGVWYRNEAATENIVADLANEKISGDVTYIFFPNRKNTVVTFEAEHATLEGTTTLSNAKQGISLDAAVGTWKTPTVKADEGYRFTGNWIATVDQQKDQVLTGDEALHAYIPTSEVVTMKAEVVLKKQNVTFEIPEDQRAFVKLGDKDKAPFYETTEPKDYFSKIVFPEPVITNGDYQEDGWYKKVGNEEKKLTAEELTNQTVKGDVTYVYKVAVKRGELVFTDGEHAQVKPQSPVTKKNLPYGTKVKSELPEVEAAANYEFNNKWQKSDASKPMTEKELEDAAVKADSATYVPVADPKTYEVSFTTKIKDGVEAPQLQNAAPTTVTYDPKNESNKLSTIPGLSDEDRKGFEIVGWHVQGKDEPEITDLSAFRFDDESTNAKGKNKAVVLVADIKVKYEVKFVTDETAGTLSESSVMIVDGGHVTDVPTFKRTNDDFAETGTWYKGSVAEGNQVDDWANVPIDAATTFIFVPDRKPAKVTFRVENGTLNGDTKNIVMTGKRGISLKDGIENFTVPEVRADEGYHFTKQWIVGGEILKNDEALKNFIPKTDSVSVRPQIEKNVYEMTFKIPDDQKDFVTFGKDPEGKNYQETGTAGYQDPVNFPETTIKNPSYEEDGWFVVDGDKETRIDTPENYKANGNTTFIYKVKKKTGTVKFTDGEHAKLAEGAVKEHTDVAYDTPVNGLLPDVHPDKNYEFDGTWQKDGKTDLTKAQMDTETVNAKTVSYRPVAVPKTYDVTFETVGEPGDTAPALVNGGSTTVTYDPEGKTNKLKTVPTLSDEDGNIFEITEWVIKGHPDKIVEKDQLDKFKFDDDAVGITDGSKAVTLIAKVVRKTAAVKFGAAEHSELEGTTEFTAKRGLPLKDGVKNWTIPTVKTDAGYEHTGKWIVTVDGQAPITLKNDQELSDFIPNGGIVSIVPEVLTSGYDLTFKIEDDMKTRVDFGKEKGVPVYEKEERVSFGDAVKFPTPEITDKNYEPDGWYKVVGDQVKPVDPTAEKATADTTYVYRAKVKKSDLTFADGKNYTLEGTKEYTLDQGQVIGERIEFPKVTPNEGYEFTKTWRNKADGATYTEEAIRKLPFDGPMVFEPVVVAKTVEKFEITFKIEDDMQKHVNFGKEKKKPVYEKAETFAKGTKVIFPTPVITDENYVEDGWYLLKGKKAVIVPNIDDVTADANATYVYRVKKKAPEKEKGKLIFEKGPGYELEGPTVFDVEKGKKIGEEVPKFPKVIPDKGYEFTKRWKTDEGVLTEDELKDLPIRGDMTLVPVVERKEYDVTFLTSEGKTLKQLKVKYGKIIPASEVPEVPQTGIFVFDYWYTTDQASKFDLETPVTGNLKLTAKMRKLNIDKSGLKDSIDKSDKTKPTDKYKLADPEKKKEFDKALEHAKKVYDDPNATQDQVDKAKKELDRAREALNGKKPVPQPAPQPAPQPKHKPQNKQRKQPGLPNTGADGNILFPSVMAILAACGVFFPRKREEDDEE